MCISASISSNRISLAALLCCRSSAGITHAVRSHRFSERNFGYKSFETAAQLQIALEELYGQQIAPAKAQGLSAAVYTQLSDVEDELNGLLTYDRKVVKMAPEVMRDIVNVGK